MRKIRVLVVDDSIVIRRLLTEVLGQDPDIELAGTAPNGRIALQKLPQLNPDLVTLDIEMPELDGLGVLPLLRQSYPKLPVIMFSTLCERGAVATLDALQNGASDYVTKPANVGSVAAGMQSVREQLIPKIKALCPQLLASAKSSPKAILPKREIRSTGRCEMVVIGSSTGGPQALSTVLHDLPADFPVPIVIVQHMPPVFTNHLANRLNQECQLEVREAKPGDKLQRGLVLIAPGNFHVELTRNGFSTLVTTNQQPPENSCRPAVDVLFRSAANLFGPQCLGVVLTGMGQDGLRGSQEIARQGGSIISQDEASSVVWGMPRAVAEAGLSSRILPLSQVGPALQEIAARGRTLRAVSAVPAGVTT